MLGKITKKAGRLVGKNKCEFSKIARKVVKSAEKGGKCLPFRMLFSLFFGDFEHLAQDGRDQGGGAQDHDLHGDTFLSM